MRTKALFITAALSAGAVSTLAQVYSVNAVGYINVVAPKGFSMIANQLDAGAGNNTVAKLLTAVPDGTTLYKYNGAGFDISSYDASFKEWDKPNMTLNPGEGAFILIPKTASGPATVTFVGEVPQGTLTTTLAKGFSIVSSKVPQSGKLDTDLKFGAGDGDLVYQFDNAKNGYKISSYDASFKAWDPAEPVPAVGESFWVKKAAAGTWTRTFDINKP